MKMKQLIIDIKIMETQQNCLCEHQSKLKFSIELIQENTCTPPPLTTQYTTTIAQNTTSLRNKMIIPPS